MWLAVDAHHVDAVHGHRDAVRLSAVKQRAAYAVDLNHRIGNSFYDYLAAGGSHRHAWRADLADRAFTRSDFREITPLGSCFISVNTSCRDNKLARVLSIPTNTSFPHFGGTFVSISSLVNPVHSLNAAFPTLATDSPTTTLFNPRHP